MKGKKKKNEACIVLVEINKIMLLRIKDRFKGKVDISKHETVVTWKLR